MCVSFASSYFTCTKKVKLQTDICYYVILIYYRNHKQAQIVFSALWYSSCYLPIVANESEISHIQTKQLTSMLQNKVDMLHRMHSIHNRVVQG